MELGRRALSVANAAKPVLNRDDLTAEYMRPTVAGLDIEKFWSSASIGGTATSTLAHPREVFCIAIREAAVGCVCVHNQPSGDPSPSSADLQLTRQLRDAAHAVDISHLDHVIVGRANADPLGRGMYSFRDAGLL